MNVPPESQFAHSLLEILGHLEPHHVFIHLDLRVFCMARRPAQLLKQLDGVVFRILREADPLDQRPLSDTGAVQTFLLHLVLERLLVHILQLLGRLDLLHLHVVELSIVCPHDKLRTETRPVAKCTWSTHRSCRTGPGDVWSRWRESCLALLE